MTRLGERYGEGYEGWAARQGLTRAEQAAIDKEGHVLAGSSGRASSTDPSPALVAGFPQAPPQLPDGNKAAGVTVTEVPPSPDMAWGLRDGSTQRGTEIKPRITRLSSR